MDAGKSEVISVKKFIICFFGIMLFLFGYQSVFASNRAQTGSSFYTTSNPYWQAGYGMPNCTCYAYGRAYELLGSEPNLCRNNARYWWDYNIDNRIYRYGSEPSIGAIACWYGNNVYEYGHVAVVEEINGNTITFSESS